jgi:hypothetical protein
MTEIAAFRTNGQLGSDPLAPLLRATDAAGTGHLLLRLPTAEINTAAAAVQSENLLVFEGSVPSAPQFDGAPCASFAAWEGVTLESRLNAGTSFAIEDVFAVLKQLAAALDALSAAGALQLCLRPATILLGEPMQVRLFDHVIPYESLTPEALAPVASSLPPEYFAGTKITAAAHVFALARIAYRLLFSQDAFASPSLSEELFRIAHTLWYEAPVGIAIKPIFERALSRDPGVRYVNCDHFVSELQTAWRAAASAPTRISEAAFVPGQPVAAVAAAARPHPVVAMLASRRAQVAAWAVAGVAAVLALVCSEAIRRMDAERLQTVAEIRQTQTVAWASAGVANMGLVNGRLSVCNSSSAPLGIHRVASVYWTGRAPHVFSSPENVQWHAQPGATTPISLSAPDGTLLWDGSTAFYVLEVDYAGQRYLTGGIWSRPPGQCLPLLHHS